MEQKQPLQQMVLGDLDTYLQKNETRSPSYTIQKNKFKMDKCRGALSLSPGSTMDENKSTKT